MDLSLVFRQGDGVLMSVFLLLLAMSVTSWWLILRRSLSRWSVRQANQQLSQAFWDAPDLDAAARLAEQHDAPLARIARAFTLQLVEVHLVDGGEAQEELHRQRPLVALDEVEIGRRDGKALGHRRLGEAQRVADTPDLRAGKDLVLRHMSNPLH